MFGNEVVRGRSRRPTYFSGHGFKAFPWPEFWPWKRLETMTRKIRGSPRLLPAGLELVPAKGNPPEDVHEALVRHCRVLRTLAGTYVKRFR